MLNFDLLNRAKIGSLYTYTHQNNSESSCSLQNPWHSLYTLPSNKPYSTSLSPAKCSPASTCHSTTLSTTPPFATEITAVTIRTATSVSVFRSGKHRTPFLSLRSFWNSFIFFWKTEKWNETVLFFFSFCFWLFETE